MGHLLLAQLDVDNSIEVHLPVECEYPFLSDVHPEVTIP